MKRIFLLLSIGLSSLLFTNCKNDRDVSKRDKKQIAKDSSSTRVKTAIGDLVLPPAYDTKSVSNSSKVVGWEKDETPKAPKGFKVERFAGDLRHPRWTYIGENGDYFVAESNDVNKSANRIMLLRDTDKDGLPDKRFVFREFLHQPFGMLIMDGYFYIANVNSIWRYRYKPGQTKLTDKGEKILDLPAGGYNHHWTRNIMASKDKSKIYVTVGSSSNVGEHGMKKEVRRANVLEINPDGSEEKVYASGLRNPVGIDINPVTNAIWVSVNERDELGDNLVPDYVTSLKEGGFYGWPYSYYGQIKDPRWKKDPHPEMIKKALIPDVPVGPHTSSLGLTFYTADAFPQKYKNGAFVGQHGSWNRSILNGYKVLFIPFEDGKPQKPQDFLTGFIKNKEKSEVYGRPAGVFQTPDGSLLVNDDASGIIWKVSVENR